MDFNFNALYFYQKINYNTETVGVRYRYTLNGEYSIHDRNVAITETSDNEICHSGVTPYEYTLVQWSDGETDIAEAQGLADYYIPTPNQS